jgi:hypothetical protein
MGEIGYLYKSFIGKAEKKKPVWRLCADFGIILRRILKKYGVSFDRIHHAHYKPSSGP